MVSFPDSAASLIPRLSFPGFDRRVTWNEAIQHTASNERFRGSGMRMVMIKFRCVFLAAGSDYKDNSLNLMPFFSTSCYTGYGDNHKASIIMLWSICVCIL